MKALGRNEDGKLTYRGVRTLAIPIRSGEIDAPLDVDRHSLKREIRREAPTVADSYCVESIERRMLKGDTGTRLDVSYYLRIV